ncbi:MAG: glycine--tRNA ligase subunit beta [Campylobacterales bacterium]
MAHELLIEIGVEELPALPLLAELENIPQKWREILIQHRLDSSFEFYYTPRRLVIFHESFPTAQVAERVELFGPPVAISFKHDEPTPAAISFAKKCGVHLDELTRAQKDGKEVLYYSAVVEGKESRGFIAEMVESFVRSLSFGKSMRWGSLQSHFIRPIRWLTILLDGHVVECKLYGVMSGDVTRVHRMADEVHKSVTGWGDYRAKLRAGGVILDPEERKTRILSKMEILEHDLGFIIEKDEELLAEVVAITEYPTVLVGQFDEQFLRLPPEVIITSMKTNQRYFPVFRNGRLSHEFIVVSNALTEDFSKVVAGNERVLRARLSDALFFYDNDLRHGLDPTKLASVLFMEGLGSMLEKSRREQEIGLRLNRLWSVGLDERALGRALELAKADLMSEMVYEFTELQGVMGSYYAQAAGESEDVVLAIREQYLPAGEHSPLPSTPLAAITALAYKLDNLMGLFSIGKIPTGSKDPLGLRRAFLGVVRIALAYRLPFDLRATPEALADLYAPFDLTRLWEFMEERLYSYFQTNISVVKAVLGGGSTNILDIAKRVAMLDEITKSDDFRTNFSTFKRVANITKDLDLSTLGSVSTDFFEKAEEEALFQAWQEALTLTGSDRLHALFGLRSHLEAFFDGVMVNAPDERLRANRLALVGGIYRSFKEFADIKEISI